MFDKSDENTAVDFTPEKLFKKLYPRLCGFANYILKDKEFSEDLVQDAFIAYLEQQKKISDDANAVKSFLYSAVKNACLNKIRHENVILAHNKKNPLKIYTDPKILEGIIHAEVMAKLYDQLDTLPAGCGMVVRYGYLEGLSNYEISKLMNISVNTVKSQKKRALGLLRIRLGKDMRSFCYFLVY